ncbi:MAG: YDG domain-containing protein [Clostridiales Family XIII bacterium]|nr:YDG domain-containing protein [Clostridiales Family XIII bacterium]
MSTFIGKHQWGRKLLAIALAAVMVFGVLPIIAPMTAYATETMVTIGQSGTTDTPGGIKTAIEAALGPNNTVTVEGALSGVTDALVLYIPVGKKVVWQATYSGSATITLFYGSVDGGYGEFEVSGGGSITIEAGSANALYVGANIIATVKSGGTVEHKAAASAVGVQDGTLIVDGGLVEAADQNAIYLLSNATATIKDGTVQNSGTGTHVTAHTISAIGAAALVIEGGTVQNTVTAANVVGLRGSSVAYYSGGTVADGGIQRIPLTENKHTQATAYYTGNNAAKFDTTGTNLFTATGADANLFRLDAAPALTQDVAGGTAYAYSSTAHAGKVVASLPAGLSITGGTADPVTATHSFSGNTVTFAGTYDVSAITIAVNGTLAGGRIPVSFTTAAFGVNVDTPITTVNASAPANITYGGTLGDPSATADAGGTDFTYSYSGTLADGSSTAYGPTATKPANPGSYTVTATLDSTTHAGSGSAAFTINKKDLSWIAGKASNKTYDGSAAATVSVQPTLSGVVGSDNVTVSNGTASFASVNVANGITVIGKGYSVGGTAAWKYNVPSGQPGFGTANITAPIPVSISGAAYKKIADKAYTGKSIKPAPALTVKNVALKQGTDYTVSYKNNTKIGKATVTVKGKGKYTGTKVISFNIVPQKTSVSKAVPGKGQLNVTWKKVSAAQEVTKYEVRYKVNGTAKWQTKTVSAKSASLTLTKLKKGKTYQVQVRSYKTVSNVKYYSEWSKILASGKVK